MEDVTADLPQAEATAFHRMRQRLIERGLLDEQFRLTPAGNDYAVGIIAKYGKRTPKPGRKTEAVKPMNDPDYQYKPRSGASRNKQSETILRRLGIPEGHRRVYGVHVPEALVATLRPLATKIAGEKGFDAAHAFVAEAEANGWKYDAPKVPPKNGNAWTEERRRKASEGAKAMHARHREDRVERTVKEQAAQQPEVAVSVQTRVQSSAVRDDRIRQVHGVAGVGSDNAEKHISFTECDDWIKIDIGYGAIWLRAQQARYAAEQLHVLAVRLAHRKGIAT